MDAYERAIRATVRPGDVVLDLGCGAGVMAFLALEAGASQVIAVEPSEAIELARRVAVKNGISRITFVKAKVRDIVLPPIDVVVADLRGALPILGDSLPSIEWARKSLAPGGRMIPQVDRIYVAPVESLSAHASVTGWSRNWGGTEYGCLSELAANQVRKVEFDASALLAAPGAMIPEIDYRVRLTQDLSLRTDYTILRSGTCHGLVAWFEAQLAEGVIFNTSPVQTPAIYGQAYFPIRNPFRLESGQVLRSEIHLHLADSEPIWRWELTPPTLTSPPEKFSTIRGKVFSIDDLKARAPETVPSLGAAGRIDRTILVLTDGQLSNREIAEALMKEYPDSFPRLQVALSRVGSVVSRYARCPSLGG